MSIPQIPTSRKVEYLVYLGLSSTITLFVITILPSNLRTIVDTQLTLFVTISSTALAGVLFAARMDKIVDHIIGRYVGKKDRMDGIAEFIGRVIVLLRLWEVVPTRIASVEEQAKQAARSVIEGEDLHEEVWTQKGIFFLVLSVLVVGVTVLMSEAAANDFMLFVLGILAAVGIPLVLLAVWSLRYREFPDRCVKVLEFRYYQGQLLTERLMRSAKKKPKSKQDSGSPMWMREGYQEIVWNSDESEEYKEALVKQCDEIDKILRRKEWIRFESQFSPIKKMLEKSANNFIKEDALDFVILAWSELLAPAENADVGELEARFNSLQLAIKPISGNDSKLTQFSSETEASTVRLQSLLGIIDPERLNPTLYKKLGKAISGSSGDGIDYEAVSTIAEWLKGDSKRVLPALKILESIDPLSYEDLLNTEPLSGDTDCSRAIIDAVRDVSYWDVAAAFPALAKLPKTRETMNEIMEYLTAAVSSDDHSVRVWAIDALAEMGEGILEYVSVHEAFATALEKSQEDLTLAVAFAIMRLANNIADYPDVINMVKGLFPLSNHYIQQKLYEALCKSGAWDDDFSTLLFMVGQARCPPNQNDISKADCKLLVKQVGSYDSAAAMQVLIGIREKSVRCLSDPENIKMLVDTIKRTTHDCIRICIAAVIGMQTAAIPEDYQLTLTKDLLEVLKDIGSLNVRYAFAHAIGNLNRDVQFELARRIGDSNHSVLSALSMHYMGDSLGPYPEIIRGLTQEISQTSESKIACLLAIAALGPVARNYPSLLDKVINILKSPNDVDTACALECLRAIGGLRVHQALKSTKREMNHWWLRDSYRKALQETA